MEQPVFNIKLWSEHWALLMEQAMIDYNFSEIPKAQKTGEGFIQRFYNKILRGI